MIYWFLISTFLTFITYAIDKWLAVSNKRRISENHLFALTFLGGTLGAVAAMLMFRHKVAKTSFLWKMCLIILLQVVVVIVWLKEDEL